MNYKELIINQHKHIKEALQVLNETGIGALFVLDDDFVLVGIITDGDIRRALLKNITLNHVVKDVMNTSFISLPVETDNSIILDHLNDSVKIIPLIDANGRLVDYAAINKIRRISVSSPLLNGNELAYVTECIKTNWISSQGKYVKSFENIFENYHEGRKSLAVSNGTVALHLALVALGIKEGDEVLVPNLTFAASVNSIIYTGAKPVLVDVDPETWNIDVSQAEKLINNNTKAIMPVHLYGHPCEMDALIRLAELHNLYVIEDCAEALGSYYKGRPVGVFGDVSTFSFYGNKTITTGEGGMIVFKDPIIAERASTLRDHGMDKSKRYWHSEVGYNYRLTNIQAAIGVAQFEQLNEFVSSKRRIANVYNSHLEKLDFFQLPSEKDETVNSYWLYTCMLKPNSPFTRDELIDYLGSIGIETRPVFFPINTMPPYKEFAKKSDLRVSENLSKIGISFPSSVNLSNEEIEFICKSIIIFCSKYNNEK
jgi:perosamine synthetase